MYEKFDFRFHQSVFCKKLYKKFFVFKKINYYKNYLSLLYGLSVVCMNLKRRTDKLCAIKMLFEEFTNATMKNIDFFYKENPKPVLFKLRKVVHCLIFLSRLINPQG